MMSGASIWRSSILSSRFGSWSSSSYSSWDVDLEKAFDTVSRNKVMATLRWLGLPDAEVRMVEATYEQTNERVIIGAGMSEQFIVNIGLRQGSALSPLLFIVVMELISRKVSMKDTSRKLLYADDLVIVAEDKEELNESLEE